MSSETRNARELLQQLKSIFLSTEFQNLEKTLMDRESEMTKSLEKARAESEMLELRCFRLEAELKEKKRAVEEMKEKVTTLTEDVSLSLERAKRAEERCSNVTKELVESEVDKVRLIEKISVLDKEKRRVEGEFVAWKNKSEELDARVASLEDYAIQLSNQDPSLKRKIVQLITEKVTGEHSLGDKRTAANGDDGFLTYPGAGSTICRSKKNESSCYGGRVLPKSSNFISIDDSGDEKPLGKGETSSEELKRKRASCFVKREGYLDDDWEDDNLPIGREKQRKQASSVEKWESYLDDDDDNVPIGRVKQKQLQRMTTPAVSPASFGQCPIRPCMEETGGKFHSLLLSDCSDDSSEDENDAFSNLTKMMMANLRAQGSK